MQKLTPMFGSGVKYSLPSDKVEEFKADYGDQAEGGISYRTKDGGSFTIPQSQSAAFKADFPDAVEVRDFQMADGTKRQMTMPELSKFLRSKEYRESADFEPPKQESAALGGVTGAIKGAGEGFWAGANAAANKISKAIPEIGVGLETAAGNALNLFGAAPNALGNAVLNDAAGAKAWLDEKLPSAAKEWTGYEDWSTKASDKVGDVAAMAYKFAPAMATGGATPFMETIFATDGINAASDAYTRAADNGYSASEASAAAAASFLVNYFGGKALMAPGMTGSMNPVLAFLGRGAEMGNVMGLQAAANKGIENATAGKDGQPAPKPFTEGMADAYMEGQVEGNLFHYMNAVPGMVMGAGMRREARREEREMLKESLLTATESADGARLVDRLIDGEGLQEALAARERGENVSRKMGARMQMPDNMSAEERNAVVDAVAASRQKVRAKEAAKRAFDPAGERAERLQAAEAEKQAVAKERRDLESVKGNEERARRKAEMGEYERQEAERKAREAAEEAAAPTLAEDLAAREAEAERIKAENAAPEAASAAKVPRTSEWPEYAAWLKKSGRTDTDKNWNKFVAERELDPALKVERGRDAKPAEAAVEKPVEKKPVEAALERPAEEAPKTPVEASAAEPAKPIETVAPKAVEATEAAKAETQDDYRYKKGIYSDYRHDVQAAVEKSFGRKEVDAIVEDDYANPHPGGSIVTLAQNIGSTSHYTFDGKIPSPKSMGEAVAEGWKKYGYKAWDHQAEIIKNAFAKDGTPISDQVAKAPDGKGKMVAEKPIVTEKPKVSQKETAPKPDGKGRMVKDEAKTEPIDTKPLADAIAELEPIVKASYEPKRYKKGKPTEYGLKAGVKLDKKEYEVKVGTTTVRFAASPEGLAAARKVLKKLDKGDYKAPAQPTSRVPAPPKPLTVAAGNKVGDFNAVAPEFFADSPEIPELNKPIVEGGYSYATDGRTLIRMPAPEGTKESNTNIEVKEVFDGARQKPTIEDFKLDVSKENVSLEQAKTSAKITDSSDKISSVELWLSPDKKLMMRSRNKMGERENSEAAYFNGESLKGADYVGMFDPEYLGRVFKTFAKLGIKDVTVEWRGSQELLYLRGGDAEVLIMPQRIGALEADMKVALLGGKRRMTDAQRAEAFETQLKGALNEMRIRKHATPAELKEYEKLSREREADNLQKMGKGETLDPLHAENIDVPRSPEAEVAERLDLHRIDPKRREDPKVLAWAKRHGRATTDGRVTPETLREFEREQATAAGRLVKNWLPGTKITYHDYGEGIKRGEQVLDLRDKAGNTLGWFDPRSKEVHLLPGANAETVAHEIMWHASRDWATTEAAKGNATAKKLLDKMHEVEKACPEALKKAILRTYRKNGVTNPDTLLNEFGAWDAMVNGGKALEAALNKRENAVWYARWWNAAKDMVKTFLSKHGKNRVELDGIDGMSVTEFKDYLAEQFAAGKTLGEVGDKSAVKTLSTKETLLQALRRKQYDVNAAIRDLERDIEKKNGKKIAFDDSAEAANALTPGLREAAKLTTDAAQQRLVEFFGGKNAHGKKLAAEDLEYYLALRASAARDAKIDAKNIAAAEAAAEAAVAKAWGTERIAADEVGFKAAVEAAKEAARMDYHSTNGSNVSPVEAKRLLREIESGSDAQLYKDAAALVRETIDETMALQVRDGLISQELADRLHREEPEYVPFKNEYDPETGEWMGRGINNFNKPEFHEAKGRVSSAGDILTHIFQDNLNAKHRGIENGVREKLAKLVEANPELGRVEKLGEAAKNPQKTLSDAKDKGNATGDPNVVVFKRGGTSYAIRMEGTRGAAIAAGITERNTKSAADLPLKYGGRFAGTLARWGSGLATRYAPFFAFRNFPKDNIELAHITFAERGPIEGAKWMAKYAANHAKNAKAISKYILTGKFDDTTAAGRLVKEWVENGGLISGGATEGYKEIKSKLSVEAIDKAVKHGQSKAWATMQTAKRALAYFNEMSELATRINVFATERQSGKSAKEAALYSRRATVDFNRHGENTAFTNTMRLFSNSTQGAAARSVLAAMTSKWGMAALGANFALGIAQEWINGIANEDSDQEAAKTGNATSKDVPEYERQTSLFAFRKGDKLYKIAQHESPFSLANYAGQCFMRVANGDMSVAEAAKNLGVSTTEFAVMLIGWGSINLRSREGGMMNDLKATLVSSAPSLAQPFAEIIADIDYKGDAVARKRYGKEKPASENGKLHTPEYAKAAARALNAATGGNEARPGWADIAPEYIQKLVEGYGKNAAREVMMTAELVKAAASGNLPDVDARGTPIVRDVVRPIEGNTDRFYRAMAEYDADVAEFDGLRAKWSEEKRAEYLEAHPWVRKSASGHRVVNRLVDGYHNGMRHVNGIQDLYKMEQGMIRTKSGPFVPHEWPKERIEQFRAERLKKQAKVLELMGR